ncbi:MAG: Tol-Pal system protein TolB [Rhodospirillaceae bacterium]|nr:Tol-Pal system protein TolB [Rhodospirillaceae bacterium]
MSGSRFTRRFFGLALMGAAVAAPAAAELRIRITDPNFEPVPIAVAGFVGETAEEQAQGQRIVDVIVNNLRNSGVFRPLDSKTFIQKADELARAPRMQDWRQIGADAVVGGRVRATGGSLRVEFRCWDVSTGQQLVGRALETAGANWRRLAHKISDAIFERITGDTGYFDTRIVYIAETGPVTRRVKRLAIMDQDGANARYLTEGSTLVLTPRFSPSAQEITYLAYSGNAPRVYILNIDTGRREVVGDFPGMTFAPRFSPDGNRIALSLETDGNSEIYTMDLRTRQVTRLTNNPAIDTSPSFSPDGRKIAFNSDRGGTQKIYVMNSDGSDVVRISNKPGRYATPVWSPRDDYIAFTKIEGSQFSIGIMRPDGEGERILAQGFLAEGPTWAPNGRYLMYFKQGRGGPLGLYTIDITGRNERRVDTTTEASDPAWSPLLRD